MRFGHGIATLLEKVDLDDFLAVGMLIFDLELALAL